MSAFPTTGLPTTGLPTTGLPTTGLRLEGFSLAHDGKPLLRDISLAVRPGESLCLIGASGGGKSLIAAAIMGLLPACMAASGWVRLGGHTIPAADQRALRRLWHHQTCLLPQEPGAALAPLLPALGQLRLAPPRASLGNERKEREGKGWEGKGWGKAAALSWLARFGLDAAAARRLPFQLSGGMAQRLLAALALPAAAPILLADEPTKGLDDARRDELLALLAALRGQGRALLIITHDLAVPRALGGGLAVLEEGRIAEAGEAATLLAAPASAFARACVAAEPRHWPPRPPATPGAEIARAEGLALRRGGRHLAGPLDLALRGGTLTALLGPSGAGKTTLGDTLLGLAPPAAGRLSWLGQGLDRRTRATLRPRFQKLHQDPTAVFPAGRPIGHSLRDLARLRPDSASRLPGLLERLGVAPALLERAPDAISGGEAQRLALARVLSLRPALLVADEPCSRLDPPTRRETLGLLRGLADQDGLAVLLVTHEGEAAAKLADHCVRMGGEREERQEGLRPS